jgi:hypothetical protein
LVFFSGVSESDNGMDGFFGRNTDKGFDPFVAVENGNGEADQTGSKAQTMGSQQNILGGQERVFARAAGAGPGTDND